ITDYRGRIEASLMLGFSNAIVEARNTQVRLLHRLAHGFKRVEALIALAMLKLSGLCPPLPGRHWAPTCKSCEPDMPSGITGMNLFRLSKSFGRTEQAVSRGRQGSSRH